VRIVAEVERLLSVAEQVEASVDDQLRRADALRRSILSAAFSGRLSPLTAAGSPPKPAPRAARASA
jgi:type I restriction enzyme S subunit